MPERNEPLHQPPAPNQAEELAAARKRIAELEQQLARQGQIEKSLSESEAQFRALFEEFNSLLDAFSDNITLQDSELRILWANQGAADSLELGPADLLGQKCYRLWHDRDEPCPICPVQTAFMSGRPEKAEVTTPDGRIFDLQAYPIMDEAGTVTRVIEVGRDISSQKKIEEDLLRAHKLESIGVLAGGIAHDFNNILMAIMGYIGIAALTSTDEAIRSYLASAEKAAKRATSLTHQLLTFAKGGAPIKQATIIDELIQQAAEFSLTGSNVSYTVVSSDDLWLADIDPDQLSQVFQNLIINADHAMPDGGSIEISCENIELAARTKTLLPLAAGSYIQVVLSDHGCGIAPRHIKKIFDPYFTTRPDGHGLGLTTAYSIIKRHQGHISVESTPDQGTSFYIYLPKALNQVAGVEESSAIPAAGQGKILVMDDEEMVREVAQMMLASSGYEVLTACDGEEALLLFEQAREAKHPFNAVILDLTVPGGMGGVETLKHLRAMDPQLRSLASSGYSNDPVMGDHTRFGFTGILAKPYTLVGLHKAIDGILTAAPPQD